MDPQAARCGSHPEAAVTAYRYAAAQSGTPTSDMGGLETLTHRHFADSDDS